MSWPFQPLLAASAQQHAHLTHELPADASNFAVTGGAAAMRLARRVSAAPGSFALTGGAAHFARAYIFSADPGSFQITGGAIGTIGGAQDASIWRDLGLCIGL